MYQMWRLSDNLLAAIIGPMSIAFILKFAIDQLKQVGTFLEVMHNSGDIKYNRKTICFSLVKYLSVLFTLVLFTYKILAVALIPIWVFGLYVIWQYIKLWKYHGYSVILLLVASFAVVIAANLIRPLLLMLLIFWWQLVLIIVTLASVAYFIFSKYDLKEEQKRNAAMRDSNKK